MVFGMATTAIASGLVRISFLQMLTVIRRLYHSPMWLHIVNLIGMFIVEIFPIPFFLLWPNSNLYKISLVLISLLQVIYWLSDLLKRSKVGISLSGNFGVFQVLTVVLSIGNFHANSFRFLPDELSLTNCILTYVLILYNLRAYIDIRTYIGSFHPVSTLVLLLDSDVVAYW